MISRELETTSKGIVVMYIMAEYLGKCNITREMLFAFYRDGAPAVLGLRFGPAK
ncbi:hypothetical protein LOAG_14153 [Loa loa]|uniref:Uncharacterized protein n=1 Tax=Loa loa TaxID=7209 RepID=A0A1S0TIA5_LOALO|nr:hypothetical protein LOAG_14153 [Loa loa]EFO14368.2 hypothetical protein LOAG_14153 [Loa loa]